MNHVTSSCGGGFSASYNPSSVPSQVLAQRQWLGGANPAGERYVTVKFRDQRIKTVPADQVDWLHDPRDPANDVVFWDFD